ncbi:hypothetical protein Back11_48870 [Paenibacillus baekrokdamisoli]|uniref:Uncharacterized protein n=1 Tax=Paenibacillus baekrokdamisoli TaxID=1712516 RepID=A0A3G9IZ40_9BACL|nr:hypothetical protein [Paenibacillus baekrokdamisoli]MBB3068712.1 hypothetical protein [Paenibacillus baekrokdamisoli]BBH23542.1 hypothetical protein Back11_48870 [Paenibacillus baekrokdamisoli]
MSERNYEFRRRLEEVHKPDRRNLEFIAQSDEIEINEDWQIIIPDPSCSVLLNVAKDLQDYFLVSMNISLRLRRVVDIAEIARNGERVIVLGDKEQLPEWEGQLAKNRSYRIKAERERIVVCGHDSRGIGQGSYYLEDLMNLREAPFIRTQDICREPLFTPRMAHSGWGLDRYPDAHLNAMAHSGIDAILIFVKDVDMTPEGYQDFNYLIDRAELYGLDVYMYSSLLSRKHPEDSGAEAYYDSTYGRVFEACPRLKGVVLVGESCEFPSKDENTTGMHRLDWPTDQPQTKPSPGWWPCTDYPQWLNMIKKVTRKYNPDVDIIFWTYNWGGTPEEDRLKLIRNIPDDVTLLVTFEMFEQIKHEGVTSINVDYSVSFEGPGQYFVSEARAAHERGIKLYTMSNTGGLTWDIGVIPYEPVPYQWARRHSALHRAQDQWGLIGLMESHHYGWWPSFISDLTKWSYWSPSPPIEETFAAVAQRDFSAEAVPMVLQAWEHWSEGIRCYIPTNEDQYGPFRVGPSFPMVFRKALFRKELTMPASSHAMFGSEIVLTDYAPADEARQSLGVSRIDVEIRQLERMAVLWRQGNLSLERALLLTSEKKQFNGRLLLGMNQFILNAVQTTIHVKHWWKLKQRLFNEPSPQIAGNILEEMEALLLKEIDNAEATIPLVEFDSRLGWEPSMEYMTDSKHLRWKIAQVRSVLDNEFPDYRKSLALTES